MHNGRSLKRRECINCRSLIPVSDYGLDYRGIPERLCKPRRAAVAVQEKAEMEPAPLNRQEKCASAGKGSTCVPLSSIRSNFPEK
jgi:hypothetical protein